jgi:peptidoglycan-N-acetylglucosamine deacetylase
MKDPVFLNTYPSSLPLYYMNTRYFIKTPGWIKRIYSSYIWSIPTREKIIYLTFDDGPHPEATPFVLNELKKQEALATFFCIGKNVVEYPELYKRIIAEGHRAGNHTQHHLNGWKTDNEKYMQDIAEAARHIDSDLFRPPYGRITKFQSKNLQAVMKGKKAKVIMWDVLSADFDEKVSEKKCLENIIFNTKPGSIIVLHDSKKCFEKLQYVLPKLLIHFKEAGYRFESIK